MSIRTDNRRKTRVPVTVGRRGMNCNLAPARQGMTPYFRWYCAAIPLEPNGYLPGAASGLRAGARSQR